MKKRFQGEHIWVIGASTGIGRAMAQALAREGAVLALSARDQGRLEDVAAVIDGVGHMVAPLDVADARTVSMAAMNIMTNFGQIDRVLFVAAQYEPMSVVEWDLKTVERIVRVNMLGAMAAVHSILPYLRRQQSGQLVLFGSVTAYRGLPGTQPYSATKAAMVNLAESLRVELAGEGIDVRLVSPGFVKTPMTDKIDQKLPCLLTADQAAEAVLRGLRSRRFEIHFPRRFTYLMKLLKWLPDALYFMIARMVIRRSG